MRERALTVTGVVGLCALAWAYLLSEASGMAEMAAMPGMSQTAAWSLTELGYLGVMWSIMMVAMMIPSTAPTILMIAHVDRTRRERTRQEAPLRAAIGITPVFVTGYLLAWTGYSIGAATVQWVLHGTLLVSPAMVSVNPVLSGGLLVAAGAFQFTPLKDRCIAHCRSPLSFVTGHWQEGRWGALRMGLHNGTYCVGCCWALMALLFVLGVMNLLWVTALAVLVLVERLLPAGRWVSRCAGVVLMVWGIGTLLAPASGLVRG